MSFSVYGLGLAIHGKSTCNRDLCEAKGLPRQYYCPKADEKEKGFTRHDSCVNWWSRVELQVRLTLNAWRFKKAQDALEAANCYGRLGEPNDKFLQNAKQLLPILENATTGTNAVSLLSPPESPAPAPPTVSDIDIKEEACNTQGNEVPPCPSGFASTGKPRLRYYKVHAAGEEVCVTLQMELCKCAGCVDSNGCPASCTETVPKMDTNDRLAGWKTQQGSAFKAFFNSRAHSKPQSKAIADAVLDQFKAEYDGFLIRRRAEQASLCNVSSETPSPPASRCPAPARRRKRKKATPEEAAAQKAAAEEAAARKAAAQKAAAAAKKEKKKKKKKKK